MRAWLARHLYNQQGKQVRTMLLTDGGSDWQDTEHPASLAAGVAKAFPALNLKNCRVDHTGGDHILLIVDEALVFRFPRPGMHGFDLEVAVLQRLQQHSPIATPIYEYVHPDGRFAGYPLISGSALTPARFAALSPKRQRAVLETAASFLAALHGLSAETIRPLEHWPTILPADYADRGLIRYLPQISRGYPEQAYALNKFYNQYRAMTTPRRVVVHGDLVAEHLLLDEQTQQLCGIIDFSDVALGDPAQDFLGFWAYGADVVQQLVALYLSTAADTGLLARSRNHFLRYRLDRLFEGMHDDAPDPGFAAAQIDALLAV